MHIVCNTGKKQDFLLQQCCERIEIAGAMKTYHASSMKGLGSYTRWKLVELRSPSHSILRKNYETTPGMRPIV